jgi:magnesium transporter
MTAYNEGLGRTPLAAGRRVVGRIVTRVHKQAGLPPGTLVHSGQRKTESVRIELIEYGADEIEEQELDRVEDGLAGLDEAGVSWINVDGLHDPSVVEALGDRAGVHRLALEDVLSTAQRPKVEAYGTHFLVILRMLGFDESTESVTSEQVSLIVGPGYLFSFQERPGDVFEPVRERLRSARGRIRNRGTDYLAYALVDAIIDSYFRILEQVGDRIEELEEQVLGDPDTSVMHRIHHLRREVLILRRAVWPLRELLAHMSREELPHVTDETRIFLRDVYDHSVQVIDTVETLRDVLSGAMELYMTGVSNRMNEVMKVLTIIATVFIPLSFFAGLYGMNFEYMPELGVRWAYPALLTFMLGMAGGMLVYFRRKGWL